MPTGRTAEHAIHAESHATILGAVGVAGSCCRQSMALDIQPEETTGFFQKQKVDCRFRGVSSNASASFPRKIAAAWHSSTTPQWRPLPSA